MQRLDSLSDSSLTSSPCSTPKTGTLSSMPSLMTTNGTLTSMKISVNGTYLSPQARYELRIGSSFIIVGEHNHSSHTCLPWLAN